MYYRLLDFFKSRTGKVFMLCLAATVIFYFVANPKGPLQVQTADQPGKLPYLAKGNLWKKASSSEVTDRVEEGGIKATRKNSDFQLLLLPDEEEEVRAAQPAQVVFEEAILPEIIWIERKPLIKSEGIGDSQESSLTVAPLLERTDPSQIKQNQPFAFQTGDLLQCQLTSPISSSQPNGLVSGRLSRAFVRHGKIILPIGTVVSGQLSSVTKGGRFLLGDQWTFSVGSGEVRKVQAVAQEKSPALPTLENGLREGRVGLPSLRVEETKTTSNNRVIGSLSRAIKVIGQDRVRTVFGSEVSPSLKNLAIETGDDLLKSQLERGDGNQALFEATFEVAAGVEFYLSARR